MASPQKENGHIDIANEIAEALMEVNLSAYEMRVLWCILRKTWGWHKKEDGISLSQFHKHTKIKTPHICRSLAKLKGRRMIIARIGKDGCIYYSFQKDYDKWKPLPKQARLPKQVISVTQTGNQPLPKQGDTKETITKETITKETISPKSKPSDIDITLTQLLIDLMLKNNPKSHIVKSLTEKKQKKWIDACRLMREKDERTPQEIEAIIKFSQSDEFWKSNILSMPKLREKFDQLWLKAQKSNYSGIASWYFKQEKKYGKSEGF